MAMDCTDMKAYRGDPALLFDTCCSGTSLTAPSASSPLTPGTCPAIAKSDHDRTVFPTSRINTQTLLSCTYADAFQGEAAVPVNPFWEYTTDSTLMGEGTEGRSRVCAFLNSARATPEGFDARVELVGEHKTAPGVLVRHRNFRGSPLTSASLPLRADCRAAVEELPGRFRELAAARANYRSSLSLPELNSLPFDPANTHESRGAGWPAGNWEMQIRAWQGQLDDNLTLAASRVRSSLGLMHDACWPDSTSGDSGSSSSTFAPESHLGNYGRLMAQLLTAGMDNARPPLSTEESGLNAEGLRMCGALPGRMAAEEEAMAGTEGKLEADMAWWRDTVALSSCYQDLTAVDASQLVGLLGGSESELNRGKGKILDAFRLVRGWRVKENATEICKRRAAGLHRWLHNAAVFHHGSPLFDAGRPEPLPEVCRMTEAEIRDEPPLPGDPPRTIAPTYGSCGVTTTQLCAALPNLLDTYPEGFGAGVLRSQISADMREGGHLRDTIPMRSAEEDPTMGPRNTLIVSLARAEAAHARTACRAQFVDPDLDEAGYLIGGNLCTPDYGRLWQFSEDPGRGACGRAIARVAGSALESFVRDWPDSSSHACVWEEKAESRSCCCDSMDDFGVYKCQVSGAA